MVEKMLLDKSIAVMQPKIFMMGQDNILDNAGTFLTKTGFLEHWGYGEKDRQEFSEEKDIFSAKGACMLIDRKVIEKVGLFDSDFGSYFEESDFCWRVRLAGKRVIYFPDVYIFHKVGFTSKRLSVIQINYHSLKNRLVSLIKNLGTINLVLVGFVHTTILIGLGIYYIVKFEFAKSGMIWKALWWNLIHLPGTLKKRKKIQKMRKVDDIIIFKEVGKPLNLIKMFSHFIKVEKNFK
jgi:GT2 family glycosyltransferase